MGIRKLWRKEIHGSRHLPEDEVGGATGGPNYNYAWDMSTGRVKSGQRGKGKIYVE